MRPRLRYALPALGAAVALAGAALAGVAAHAGTKAKPIKVTVIETEYKFKFSTTRFKPGTYTFTALDRGKLAHSLAISGPGVKSLQLKDTINPGSSASLTVTLVQGRYAIWCPVPGHAQLGLKATITVSASGGGISSQPAATSSQPAATTSTTSGGSGGKGGGWG